MYAFSTLVYILFSMKERQHGKSVCSNWSNWIAACLFTQVKTFLHIGGFRNKSQKAKHTAANRAFMSPSWHLFLKPPIVIVSSTFCKSTIPLALVEIGGLIPLSDSKSSSMSQFTIALVLCWLHQISRGDGICFSENPVHYYMTYIH